MKSEAKQTIELLTLISFVIVVLGILCGYANQINAILAGIGGVLASFVVNILTDLYKNRKKTKQNEQQRNA